MYHEYNVLTAIFVVSPSYNKRVGQLLDDIAIVDGSHSLPHFLCQIYVRLVDTGSFYTVTELTQYCNDLSSSLAEPVKLT
jgi:hypothetical protein